MLIALKNVYGMPNAGYIFATALDTHLSDLGFTPSRGDHNLHRRFNENREIQLYASYIDDGTALFPHDHEYETFVKELQSPQHNGQTFELGLAQVQEETLGCKVQQALHQSAIGNPGEDGVPSTHLLSARRTADLIAALAAFSARAFLTEVGGCGSFPFVGVLILRLLGAFAGLI